MSKILWKKVPFPSKKNQHNDNKVQVASVDLLLWSVRNSQISWTKGLTTNDSYVDEEKHMQAKYIYRILMNYHFLTLSINRFNKSQDLQHSKSCGVGNFEKLLENHSLNHTSTYVPQQTHWPTDTCAHALRESKYCWYLPQAKQP